LKDDARRNRKAERSEEVEVDAALRAPTPVLRASFQRQPRCEWFGARTREPVWYWVGPRETETRLVVPVDSLEMPVGTEQRIAAITKTAVL